MTNKKTSGFTIVELLIVIVVIGILAALVLNTFSGVQARARDTERKTDVSSIAAQLEIFYSTNGYYPSFALLTSSGWISSNLKGLDPNAARSPADNDSADSSLTFTATPTVDQYGYQAYDINGALGGDCDNTDTDSLACKKFKFFYNLEDDADDTAYTKSSLN